MAWIKTIDEGEAKGKVHELYQGFKEQIGFIPILYNRRRFGFLFVTLDNLLEDYFAQKQIHPYQWIPMVFGSVAFPISIAALVRLNPFPID
jgi:hypothetical protein